MTDKLGHSYWLGAADIKHLLVLNPLVSLGTIGLEWLMILGAMLLHILFYDPILYLFIWLFIGTRMYALYALLHDGMHYLLFPSKKINDLICIVFLAGPLFISLKKIRKVHFLHHAHLKTEMDPENIHLDYEEFKFPQSAFSLFGIFILDILGINYIRYKVKKIWNLFIAWRKGEQGGLGHMLSWGIKWGIICTALVATGLAWDFFFCWLVPYATVYQSLNRLRLASEHISVDEENIFSTRTLKPNAVERFFLSPNSLGYHTEHHAFPAVPFYRLSDLHTKLMELDKYKKHVQIEKSYISVIRHFVASSRITR